MCFNKDIVNGNIEIPEDYTTRLRAILGESLEEPRLLRIPELYKDKKGPNR